MGNGDRSISRAFLFALGLVCGACQDQGPAESLPPLPLPLTNRIVFESKRADTLGDVFAMNLDGTDPRRLTDASTMDACPSLAPDGNWIALYRKAVSDPDLPYDERPDSLAIMNANGSDVRMLVELSHFRAACPIWAPDSRSFAVHEEFHSQMGETPTFQVRTFAPDGRLLAQFVVSGFADLSFSPDGSRFVGTRFGVSQCCGALGHTVMTLNIDGTGSRNLGAGMSPRWSAARNEIVYLCSDPNDSPYALGDEDVCMVADDGSAPRMIVADPPDDAFFDRPAFTSDGSTAALRCGANLCVIDLQTSAVHRSVFGVPARDYVWMPDNQRLVFRCQSPPSNGPPVLGDICSVRRDGTGLVNLTNHPAVDGSPSVGPGGA